MKHQQNNLYLTAAYSSIRLCLNQALLLHSAVLGAAVNFMFLESYRCIHCAESLVVAQYQYNLRYRISTHELMVNDSTRSFRLEYPLVAIQEQDKTKAQYGVLNTEAWYCGPIAIACTKLTG